LNAPDAVVEARTLVDAWLPEAHAALGDCAPLNDLVASGAGREQRWAGFASGRIEVTADAGRLVRADGTPHPRRFALGPFTSSPAKGGFARPHTNAIGFRENDATARAVLADLAAAGGAVASAPAIVIRRALPREHEAVGELCLAAYTADYPVGESYAAALRDTGARTDEFDVWVAAEHTTGELVGTVSILKPGLVREGRSVAGELYFRLLAVSPAARRRGIGAALTRFAFEVARERGQHAVVLNSVDHMLPAHALYRSLGFERVSERDVRNPDNTVFTFAKAVTA
jgi:ribosomal protein S18 acetylase RimI-like enzyme